jgi:hypothetical protein
MTVTAGIDSWSPCWYLDPQSAAAGILDELAHVPAARGTLMPAPVAGHRVGWNRSAGMLYAEGHPSGAMPGEWSQEPLVGSEALSLHDRPEPWLVPPGQLPVAYEGLVGALEASGVPVPSSQWSCRPEGLEFEELMPGREFQPGFGGLRRCDSTVDFEMGSRARGLAVLAGVAAVATTVPRCQGEVKFAKDGSGGVETVYLRGYSGVKILGRWYDKGLESGSAPRGERVRAEDQRRYPKGHRRGIYELEGAYVRSKFQQRFYPLWQATKGVTVGGVLVIHNRLADLVQEGEVSARQAEQLAGFVALQKLGVAQKRSTVYNRRKLLRELGLVAAEGCLEEVEVDLHEVLEEALDSPSWCAQG